MNAETDIKMDALPLNWLIMSLLHAEPEQTYEGLRKEVAAINGKHKTTSINATIGMLSMLNLVREDREDGDTHAKLSLSQAGLIIFKKDEDGYKAVDALEAKIKAMGAERKEELKRFNDHWERFIQSEARKAVVRVINGQDV